MNKPYSISCERNQEAILSVLKPILENSQKVLEIGSGTGQHAVYFAEQLPQLIWQSSDQQEYLPGINLWLEEADLDNTPPPLVVDVTRTTWQDLSFDAVFSANTVHIMGWQSVKDFIAGAGSQLPIHGQLILYGPYNYKNLYTSDSNRQFDIWLKDRDPVSGIRNFEDMMQITAEAGLALMGDYEMPANNRVLCWRKEKNIT
jgi:cyclopropane fatty-acyl-phospholipid synthase-like methyltransferase